MNLMEIPTMVSVLTDCLFTARLSDVFCAVRRDTRQSAEMSPQVGPFPAGWNRRTRAGALPGDYQGTAETLHRLSMVPRLTHTGAGARPGSLVPVRRLKKFSGAVGSSPI